MQKTPKKIAKTCSQYTHKVEGYNMVCYVWYVYTYMYTHTCYVYVMNGVAHDEWNMRLLCLHS